MKQKVLYVVSSLRSCGPVNQLLGIVTNLDQTQFEFSILTLSPEPENSRKKEFIDAGITIDSLNLSRVQYAVKGKKQLKNYIERISPDVIHTTGVRLDTAIANLGYGPKQVMSIRNYAFEDYVAKFGKLAGTYFAKNTIKAINKAKFPVCCSYSLKEMYSSHVNTDLSVVQNGVDVVKYSPSEDNDYKMRLRKELNLPEDKLIFIAVGSLIKRKDPLTLIDAFKKANLKDAIFLLLGDGDLMDECKTEANDQIILKGSVSNVTDYLRASDVYMSASHSEGLPNSVLEAGRTGVSLLLSSIPQHKEVFMHGNEMPFLFQIGDSSKLAEGIKDQYNKEDRSINYALAEYIKDHYSNESMSAHYQRMYKKV